MLLEIGAAQPVRFEIAVPGEGVAARDVAERLDIGLEAVELGIDHRVGPVGRDHAPLPAGRLDRVMRGQRIERALGRGDHLDLEALEQGARPEIRPGEAFADAVEIVVGGLRREPHRHAEQLGEGLVEPQPRRRAAKQVIVLGELAPDLACVGLDRSAVLARDAHLLERHALAVEHAENVVVRSDEQPRGVREWRVLRIPARVGVAVRRDDRQVAHFAVEPAGHRAGREIHREQAIRIDQGRGEGGSALGLHP